MKIVKLKGGLGNQLFQYAFAKRLAELTDEPVKLDMSYFSGLLNDPIRKPRILKFCLSLELAGPLDLSKVLLLKQSISTKKKTGKALAAAEMLLNKKYCFEKDRSYRDPQRLLDYNYYDGYWQSWRIVEDVWEDINKDLVSNSPLDPRTEEMIRKVRSEESVFVGVRRGDYTDHPEHWGRFSDAYYNDAMSYIESKVDDPVFYIFSNDIEWVKANMNFDGHHIVYRENADIIDDFDDLLLMASCRHGIMINSTYHWWAARLNDNPDKIVIAPNKWFFDGSPIDIIPPEWTRFPAK